MVCILLVFFQGIKPFLIAMRIYHFSLSTLKVQNGGPLISKYKPSPLFSTSFAGETQWGHCAHYPWKYMVEQVELTVGLHLSNGTCSKKNSHKQFWVGLKSIQWHDPRVTASTTRSKAKQVIYLLKMINTFLSV